MGRIHQDAFIGIGITIFSLYFYIKTGDIPTGADLFPQIILTTFGLLGIAIFISGLRKGKKQQEENNEEKLKVLELKLPMFSLLVIVIYIALLNVLGFFVSTTLFIIGFMIFYQMKSIKVIAMTVIIVNLFIYLLFVYQLNVQLPKGLLL